MKLSEIMYDTPPFAILGNAEEVPAVAKILECDGFSKLKDYLPNIDIGVMVYPLIKELLPFWHNDGRYPTISATDFLKSNS